TTGAPRGFIQPQAFDKLIRQFGKLLLVDAVPVNNSIANTLNRTLTKTTLRKGAQVNPILTQVGNCLQLTLDMSRIKLTYQCISSARHLRHHRRITCRAYPTAALEY
ncbi:hypothetical protein X777_13304, partial [Ooceraea biroi]